MYVLCNSSGTLECSRLPDRSRNRYLPYQTMGRPSSCSAQDRVHIMKVGERMRARRRGSKASRVQCSLRNIQHALRVVLAAVTMARIHAVGFDSGQNE